MFADIKNKRRKPAAFMTTATSASLVTALKDRCNYCGDPLMGVARSTTSYRLLAVAMTFPLI